MASCGRHFISMLNSSQYEQVMKIGGVKICETRDRFLNIQLTHVGKSYSSNEPFITTPDHARKDLSNYLLQYIKA